MSNSIGSFVGAIPKWAIAIALAAIVLFMALSMTSGKPFKVMGYEFGFDDHKALAKAGGTEDALKTLDGLQKEVRELKKRFAAIPSPSGVDQETRAALSNTLVTANFAKAELSKVQDQVSALQSHVSSNQSPTIKMGEGVTREDYDWTSVEFESDFKAVPYVFVTTKSEKKYGYPVVFEVTRHGFKVRIEDQVTDKLNTKTKVGFMYVAMLKN
jgi:hypothetical protein